MMLDFCQSRIRFKWGFGSMQPPFPAIYIIMAKKYKGLLIFINKPLIYL